MKLSELKTLPADKYMSIMGEVSANLGKITDDEDTVALIENTIKKTLSGINVRKMYMMGKAQKKGLASIGFEMLLHAQVSDVVSPVFRLVSAIMQKFPTEVFNIVSVLSEKSVLELKQMPFEDFKTLALELLDSDMKTLFTSADATDEGA